MFLRKFFKSFFRNYFCNLFCNSKNAFQKFQKRFLFFEKKTYFLFPANSGDEEEVEELTHDENFWVENDKKIEKRFEDRKARLAEFCKNIYPPELDHTMHDWNHRTRHFYVGDGEHKLLGCVPLKAGCTSWIFWQTSMHYPGTSKHSMNMARVAKQFLVKILISTQNISFCTAF